MKKVYKTTVKRIELKFNKTDIPKCKIYSSADAYSFAKNFYFDDIDIYESFFIIGLNSNNTTMMYSKISQGGTCGTVVDIKIICKLAIDSLCDNIILVHNHPSGNTKPSEADKYITKKITEGLKLLDITVLDHVIISSENDHYSFADEGLINF